MAAQIGDEDYGDYVTRCICGFTHDDGYMICCDQCSVWQHVDCMKVNPKNLPDKYLCEQCQPRTVDKKRARLIQGKKKEDVSDFDEDDSSSDRSHSVSHSRNSSPHPPSVKKRKKAQRTSSGGTLRVHELKAEARRGKREKEEGGKKNVKKKTRHHHSLPHQQTPPHSLMSGLQTLLTAASALEEQQQQMEQEMVTTTTDPSQPINTLFNCTTSPWNDPYKATDTNNYSEPLREVLKGQLDQLKKEVVVYTREEYNGLGSFPLCLLREVGTNRKGLISEAHIPEDEMIMEYKAKITTKESLCKEMEVPNRLLWKQKPCPFVFQYDKISGVGVCLDARHLGNTARFIRRSCNPNAELRHFFVNDDVHFGVYAINHISPEEEVSLPFDFPHDKCDYSVECACGRRTSCHVTRGVAKTKRTRKEPKSSSTTLLQQDTETTPIIHNDTPVRRHLLGGRGRALPMDEDSNHSCSSVGSRKKIKRSFSQSSTSQQNSRDPTDSESEDTENESVKKRKSREERKTEAVWRMFEKMEAGRGRRKLTSSSDGGATPHEEVTGYSPGGPKLEGGGGKERRPSGNSRKVQLLPGKHHLSSVSSSVDLLSPEHPDAFSSPPLTPSLPHPSNDPLQEPPPFLPPPFATMPKLNLEVTPYLHPKYLLADFTLPRKKAILRQWEMEQSEQLLTADTDNAHWISNGFALACIKAMEGDRPRQRGCLKHRWMDLHSKESQNGETLKMPHKKRFLQKWLDNCPTPEPLVTPPTNLTPPPSSTTSPSLSTSQLPEQKDPPTLVNETTPIPTDPEVPPILDHTHKEQRDIEGIPSSSLFDDFSDDDDFSDLSDNNGEGKRRGRRDTRSSEATPLEAYDKITGSDNEDCPEPIDHTHSATTVQYSAPFDSVSPEPISTLPTLEATPTAPPLMEIPSIKPDSVNDIVKFEHSAIEEISGDEDNNCDEMELSSPPAPVDQSDDLGTSCRDDDKSIMDMSLDSNDKSLLLSPFSDIKPGGAKRKMSLLEYRNRARKPSEQSQKKPSSIQDVPLLSSSVMTTPTSSQATPISSSFSPSSHSFLSYSSSFLSGSSTIGRINKPSPTAIGTVSSPVTMTTPTTRPLDTGPQFEPVSPDEGDRTPLTDEAPLTRPSSLTSLLPPPPPPPPPSSVPYTVPPRTPTGILPPGGQPQMMWGPGLPIDMSAHDPRRVHQPPPNPDVFIHRHPSPMSPQDMLRPPHFPPHPPMPRPPHPPYNTMIPHPQQMRPGGPMGMPHPPGVGGTNVFMGPHPPRMPHPPLLHQTPPPRHPNNNNYY